MIKKFVLLLLAPLFLLQAHADQYCGPCPDLCCDGEWTVYADWLYWNARRAHLDYAYQTPVDVGNRTLSRIQPGYESGFRVGLLYECYDNFMEANYARFHTTYSDSLVSTDFDIRPTRIFSDAANGFATTSAVTSWTVDYDAFDLLAGTQLFSCNCIVPYLFGGFKLAFIDQTFVSDFTRTDGINRYILTQKVDMKGYGVEFGFGADTTFCSCFDFFSRVSTDLLISDFDRSWSTLLTSPFPIVVNDSNWNMVTAINFTLGINYSYRFNGCFCGSLDLAIGYELHHYLGMPCFLEKFNDPFNQDYTVEHATQSLSFDGLFIRAGLGF